MWLLDVLYGAMPEGWMVYQEFMFADATTFISYNANMRQLVYDKLKSCELVVFNRFKPDMDKMEFHKIVRAASRRADIAYEYAGGKVEYDDIVDPLPFDINAPIIEIGDADFAEWYRDMSEEPKKYENKTVRFKCRALVRKKMPEHSFIVGRHVMTCCVEDIQFAGLVCQWDKANTVQDDTWIILTARINFKFNRAYSRKGTGADIHRRRALRSTGAAGGNILLGDGICDTSASFLTTTTPLSTAPPQYTTPALSNTRARAIRGRSARWRVFHAQLRPRLPRVLPRRIRHGRRRYNRRDGVLARMGRRTYPHCLPWHKGDNGAPSRGGRADLRRVALDRQQHSARL